MLGSVQAKAWLARKKGCSKVKMGHENGATGKSLPCKSQRCHSRVSSVQGGRTGSWDGKECVTMSPCPLSVGANLADRGLFGRSAVRKDSVVAML